MTKIEFFWVKGVGGVIFLHNSNIITALLWIYFKILWNKNPCYSFFISFVEFSFDFSLLFSIFSPSGSEI